MAEDPFGPGGPEIEEITIEANPLDQLAIDPEMLELVQNGDGIEMEDGSFEFSMEEGDLEKSQLPFDSNISEHLEDSILYGMSSDILSHISEDKSSRKEWEDAYRTFRNRKR